MKLLTWKKVAVSNAKYTREYPVTVRMGESRQISSVIVYEIHVHIKYAYLCMEKMDLLERSVI
jgi:hypothetical protein